MDHYAYYPQQPQYSMLNRRTKYKSKNIFGLLQKILFFPVQALISMYKCILGWNFYEELDSWYIVWHIFLRPAYLNDLTSDWFVDMEPVGLAVDWVYGHLYWTDTVYRAVMMSNLDGTGRVTIVTKDLIIPRGIAVHPDRRFVQNYAS